jgi:hypothetical protein
MPTFDAGISGLVGTVGCTILHTDGSSYQSRATAGITEPITGSGVYAIADPDSTLTLIFVWDVGAGTISASETLYAGRGEDAAIADKILNRDIAGGADGTRTVGESLAATRNKVALTLSSPTAGTLTVYAADDTAVLWTAAVTVDSASGLLTVIDPA